MPEHYQHTVIAAFNNDSSARDAVEALRSAGFPDDCVYFESANSERPGRRIQSTHEGGIKGWFKSLFTSGDHEDRAAFEDAYHRGYSLVRVDVDEAQVSQVEDILNQYSPSDVHEQTGSATSAAAASTSTTAASTSRTAASTPTATGTSGTAGYNAGYEGRTGTSDTQAVPVINEDLQVGKRQVLKGGVRLYSRLSTQPVEEQVSLREERVRVDRQPVNRPATSADYEAARDKVIEVQEYAERPVVAKEARVVEEVRVGKDVTERTETIRDNVTRSEVNVDRTPTGSGYTDTDFDDSDFRSDFQTRYGASGGTYDTYAPAYQYGYTAASDPRYQGRPYSEVESDLRSDYDRRYPGGTWEKVKDAVRYGWDKVTGKARGAAR